MQESEDASCGIREIAGCEIRESFGKVSGKLWESCGKVVGISRNFPQVGSTFFLWNVTYHFEKKPVKDFVNKIKHYFEEKPLASYDFPPSFSLSRSMYPFLTALRVFLLFFVPFWDFHLASAIRLLSFLLTPT